MRILALYASVNAHGNDAKGAFIPQATLFAKHHRAAGHVVELVPFDPTIAVRAKRRAAFLAIIAASSSFDAIVYFGHGLRTGLPSAGFTLEQIDELAGAIHAKASKRLIVTLYACSTAGAIGRDRDKLEGDGGFADELRDRLSVLGHTGWIDAHTTAAHTTINPHTRRFYLDGIAKATGGAFIVAPGSPEWKSWHGALKTNQELRFGFPFMTAGELHARLAH